MWGSHRDHNVRSRLSCFRKLRSFRVRENILQVFFFSFFFLHYLQFSNLWLCLLGRECFTAGQDRDRLEKTIRKAGEVIGRQQETSDSVCHRQLTDRLSKSLADDTHLLRAEFDSRLIDRSGRLKYPSQKQHALSSHSFIHSESHTDIQPAI